MTQRNATKRLINSYVIMVSAAVPSDRFFFPGNGGEDCHVPTLIYTFIKLCVIVLIGIHTILYYQVTISPFLLERRMVIHVSVSDLLDALLCVFSWNDGWSPMFL